MLTDLGDGTEVTSVSEDQSARWIDRLDPRLVRVLTGLGFGLPAALCYWMVAHYGVNASRPGDQLDDVTVIQSSYTTSLGGPCGSSTTRTGSSSPIWWC